MSAGPHMFYRQFRKLARGVALVAALLLVGACGGTDDPATADIITVDLPPDVPTPVLTINSPASGALVTLETVLVTGVAEKATSGQILINGVEAQVEWPIYSGWAHLAEGANTITVEHQPSGVQAEVTVTLDTLPPVLELASPLPGEVHPTPGAVNFDFLVEDETGITELKLGATTMAVQTGQVSTKYAPFHTGMNIIAVEAVDNAGHVAREHTALVRGPLEPCDPPPGAYDVVVDLGPEAMEVAAEFVCGIAESFDVDKYLAGFNPVFQTETISVSLDNIDFEGLQLELGVEDLGLKARVVMDSISAFGTVQLSGEAPANYAVSGEVLGLDVELGVTVHVKDGDFQVDVDWFDVWADNVSVAVTDDDGNSILAPVEVSGNFLEFVSTTASTAIFEGTANYVQEAIAYTQGAYTFEVLGWKLGLQYAVTGVDVLQDTLRVAFSVGTDFSALGDLIYPWDEGCPDISSVVPSPAAYPGITIYLAADFINRNLIELWRRGMFDFEVDQEQMNKWKVEVELVAGLLGSLLDFVPTPVPPDTPLKVAVHPLLPPMLSGEGDTVEGAKFLAMKAGGIRIEYLVAQGTSQTTLASTLFSTSLGVKVSVTGGICALGLKLEKFYLDINGLSGEGKRRSEESIETHFEYLVPEIIDTVFYSLVKFGLPSVYGIGLGEAKGGTNPDTGYLHVQGALVLQ